MRFYLEKICYLFFFIAFQWITINSFWESYKKYVVNKNGYVVEASFIKDVKPCRRKKHIDQHADVLFKNKIYEINVSCSHSYKKGDRIELIYSDYYDVLATPYYRYGLDLALGISMFLVSFLFLFYALVPDPPKKMKLGRKNTVVSELF
jgi:hypothetical protein